MQAQTLGERDLPGSSRKRSELIFTPDTLLLDEPAHFWPWLWEVEWASRVWPSVSCGVWCNLLLGTFQSSLLLIRMWTELIKRRRKKKGTCDLGLVTSYFVSVARLKGALLEWFTSTRATQYDMSIFSVLVTSRDFNDLLMSHFRWQDLIIYCFIFLSSTNFFFYFFKFIIYYYYFFTPRV